jgi:hypothetical protein
VVDTLLPLLRTRLDQHNQAASLDGGIRLRAAAHIGEVHRDHHGFAGTSVNYLFRLLEAPILRSVLAKTAEDLILITSDYYYTSVIRQEHDHIRTAFRPVPVCVKNTHDRGWIAVPGRRPGSTARAWTSGGDRCRSPALNTQCGACEASLGCPPLGWPR